MVSDDVYKHMLFDDTTHRPIATYEVMRERTITISSATPPLIAAIQRVKQYLSFVGASPFQPAVVYALDNEREWITHQQRMLQGNRDLLSHALKNAGFHVSNTKATFYIVADSCDLSTRDGPDFCYNLIADYNVAAIPISVFTDHLKPWVTKKLHFTFGNSLKKQHRLLLVPADKDWGFYEGTLQKRGGVGRNIALLFIPKCKGTRLNRTRAKGCFWAGGVVGVSGNLQYESVTTKTPTPPGPHPSTHHGFT
ncbi:aminotransferase class I/II-fold pyridoxal phosphate-dependent enzyme [Corynebacterium diphtheriae]|nr:aminotransferase class I/II-fold pyridoxal phosphate-dependent enzyme [Corynebacterium diphtheriae]